MLAFSAKDNTHNVSIFRQPRTKLAVPAFQTKAHTASIFRHPRTRLAKTKTIPTVLAFLDVNRCTSIFGQ